jgi:TolB-like protein
LSRYFDELKRRNVFRVGAAYAVVGWLVIEVVDTLVPRMAMPEWVAGFFIILVLIGFPIALLFSWAFEMTPEGLKKTAEVDVGESITTTTGQKINYVIISALAAVVLFQQFAPSLSAITSFTNGTTGAETIAIAVLPFADLSAGGDQEYLGDGVAEEILNVLAGIDGLKVTSRTSAFVFKDQNLAIPEIAKALGVSHVVEGSVRKQDARVRITAQLIEVSGDSHLWSETYDSDLSDIFRLQDEIANKISSALSTNLGLALPAVARETPDWDIAAYELYLRARQLVLARIDFDEAIALLDTAIKIEPEFADAWAEKATALALTAYGLGLDDETVAEAYATYDEAWVAASRATDLDPGHTLGVAVQGLVRLNQRRFIEARVLFERSLSQKSADDNAILWMAILLFMTGADEQALAMLEAGLESSPTAPNLLRWRDRARTHLGGWQQIWDERESVSMVEMRDAVLLQQIAGLKVGEVSVEDFEKWARTEFPEMLDEELSLIGPLAAAVRNGSADELEPQKLAAILESDFLVLPDMVYALDTDLSAVLLVYSERLLDTPNRNFMQNFWAPKATTFRQRPETLQLFHDLGLPAYWDLYGWPDLCRRTDVNNFVCD